MAYILLPHFARFGVFCYASNGQGRLVGRVNANTCNEEQFITLKMKSAIKNNLALSKHQTLSTWSTYLHESKTGIYLA